MRKTFQYQAIINKQTETNCLQWLETCEQRIKGIKIMQHRLNKEEVKRMCEQYIHGENSIILSSRYKVSPVAICNLLERRGIKRRPQNIAQKKCQLNENVFDMLTPESSYWVGFFFADGTIIERSGSPELAIVLSEKDRNHVEKFRSFLQSTHKIIHVKSNGFHNGKDCKRFCVRSNKLVNKLKGFGWKSKLQSTAVSELTFCPHFWRGVIDGDGCIGMMSGKRSHYPRLELVGGYILMSQFIEYIHTIIPNYHGTARPHKSIFKVGLSSNTAFKIIDILYSLSHVSLDRKYNAAINILTVGQTVQALSTQ